MSRKSETAAAGMPGRRRLLEIAGALTIVGLPFSAEAELQAVFPEIHGATLEGKPVTLPADLPGVRTVVMVTQKEAHTPVRVIWGDRLAPRSVVPVNDLALFDDYGAVFRGIVTSKMNDGIANPAARKGVVLVYGNRAGITRQLGIDGDEELHILVVDRRFGTVVAHERGDATPEKVARVKEAVSELNPGPNPR